MKRDTALQISSEERTIIFDIAKKLNLVLIRDWPYSKPSLEIYTSISEDLYSESDVFFLIKTDWIFGPFIFNEINAGYRKGTFAIQPRVNFCCIEIYLPKKRGDGDRRRLIPGSLVLRDKPILSQNYKEGISFGDAVDVYKKFIKDLKKIFHTLKIGSETVLISSSNIINLKKHVILPAYEYQDNFFEEIGA